MWQPRFKPVPNRTDFKPNVFKSGQLYIENGYGQVPHKRGGLDRDQILDSAGVSCSSSNSNSACGLRHAYRSLARRLTYRAVCYKISKSLINK